jgi:hypothetical protein
MVEKANDAWARIGSIWKGLTQQLAINFAPILTEIALRFKQIIIDGGGVGPMAEMIVLNIAKMGAAAWNTMNKVHSGWLTFKSAIIAGTGEVLGFWAKMEDNLSGDVVNSLFWWTNLLPDAKTSKDMAEALLSEASGLILDADAFVPMQDIEKKLQALKDKLLDLGIDPIQETFEVDIIDLPDIAKNFKGAAENLSTAIGGMKVEADSQSRILNQQLGVAGQQLATSRGILDEIRNTRGVLL